MRKRGAYCQYEAAPEVALNAYLEGLVKPTINNNNDGNSYVLFLYTLISTLEQTP